MPQVWAAYSLDAVTAFALAAHELRLRRRRDGAGSLTSSRDAALAAVRAVDFSGATGRVHFDLLTGDRLSGVYAVLNTQQANGQCFPMSSYFKIHPFPD